MKGFPNQISDLSKLSYALVVANKLIVAGKNVFSDEVYGEALVRAGVVGTGHSPMPVEDYLIKQKKKPAPNRSFQTTARGLRELFKILGILTDSQDDSVTPAGKCIVSQFKNSSTDLSHELLEIWRGVIRSMTHNDKAGNISHPYQVLLRLIAKKPGISRAKCALALEAHDDSEDELKRIVLLSEKHEHEILDTIGVTKNTWDNAKKILPSFAEQLGDARKVGDAMYLSNSPGVSDDKAADTQEGQPLDSDDKKAKKPRSSRKVDAGTIAQAGTLDTYDEAVDNPKDTPDAETLAKSKEKLLDRLKRHNLIVQRVAEICENNGAELYENPFDCLACFEKTSLLIEVKSLDGGAIDERERVRDALGQILYYEAFVTEPYAGGRSVIKVVVFESRINEDHADWLRSCSIEPVWLEGGKFSGNAETVKLLTAYFGDNISAS